MVNHAADSIEVIQAEIIKLNAVLASYDALAPDTTGTAVEGQGDALRAKLTALANIATDPMLDAVVSAKVPTHKKVI